jgi:6-phosphogluconolactonase
MNHLSRPLPRRVAAGVLLLTALLGSLPAPAADPAECLVYFGTYTRGKEAKSKGIYVSRFDVASGKLSQPQLAVETASPSFLALHPNGKSLYAVGEVPDGGGVKAFAIDRASGKLKTINEQSTRGTGPTHLAVDATGKALVVANYGSGSVASLPIKENGSLGAVATFVQHQGSSVNQKRQAGPHAHCVNVSPDNSFVVSADLGIDKVMIYQLDADKATLSPGRQSFVRVAPGSGPRHFAFHPEGKFAYVINEMTCTMTAFAWDAKRGSLKEIQTVSTLPEGVAVGAGMSTAEVFAHPNGKVLYGSNRGHDTIAVFSIGAGGKLQLLQNAPAEVKIPRNFNLDPTGRWLLACGQNSNDVAVHRVDEATGKLTFTGQKVAVGSPVCAVFLPVK